MITAKSHYRETLFLGWEENKAYMGKKVCEAWKSWGRTSGITVRAGTVMQCWWPCVKVGMSRAFCSMPMFFWVQHSKTVGRS